MDKSAIKNFAVTARKKLIDQVMLKAFQIGITAKGIKELKEEAGHIILNDVPQEKSFKLQRDKLIKEIEHKGYNQVMEEAAYIWFNRFISLRFMEVNDYLPTGVRVLSSRDPNKAEPDIIREALNVDLNLDRNLIYNLQDKNNTDELFKYLLIRQCNELNKILPFMFEKISDYTELLFPDNLLQEGSVLRSLVNTIPSEDWREVEIIGWLYQYYISEKKDEVFADLKKNKKISKENIPAATQLFTPKWIVQYMVENSLGRLWIESHPNDELKAQWKYFLEEAEQEPEVQKQLDELKNPNLNPLELKVLDPCCGSGHILVYTFEVLYEIYKSYGYMEEETPKLILENNLYGLDIDDRAAQLASFAVMMKARSKSRGVFREDIKLNICAIQESNWMSNEVKEILVDKDAMELEQCRQQEIISYLAHTFRDAKEYGSILDVRELDLEFLEQRLEEINNSAARDLLEVPYRDVILDKLPGVILQAKIMGAKYDVVCTNPPYMGAKGINERLSNYLTSNYPFSKTDLFAVFIERVEMFTKAGCFNATINQHSWMFLTSFQKLRERILGTQTIISLIHLGPKAFEEIAGEIVQSTSYVLRKTSINMYNSAYKRLVDYLTPKKKEEAFFLKKETFNKKQNKFFDFPGRTIAYWTSDKMDKIFALKSLSEFAEPKSGLSTADDNKYLRLWHEVNSVDICFFENDKKYVPYTKGGSYRKWFGNNEYLVYWNNNGEELKNFPRSVIRNPTYYFREGLTWATVTTSRSSFRYTPPGFIYGNKGNGLFSKDISNLFFLLGLLNSKVTRELLKVIAPTISLESGYVSNLPICQIGFDIEDANRLVIENVKISEIEWDSFETSWNFKRHPFLNKDINLMFLELETKLPRKTIKDAYEIWEYFTQQQFAQLKANEEELNRIFIDIYGLQEELTPEVEDKDITIRKADRERDIKSFISYAVGCMLGRYSLDEEGLIFAGGKFDPERYKTFKADADGILPVLGDAYFDDDIVSKFIEFVKVTFGENTLAKNLDYIAETLGRKTNESSREYIRRYFLKDFYKDHVQTYKKRPIYWLFTSGKEQGFNALIYMHRYDSSVVSRVRTDYLHPLQNKLEAEFLRLNKVLVSEDSPSEKTKATKKLKVLTKQMEELKKYDEVIHNLADQHIEIDLDDGVVVNYAKFEKVLAKI